MVPRTGLEPAQHKILDYFQLKFVIISNHYSVFKKRGISMNKRRTKVAQNKQAGS
jgi:hypothetical protein